MRVCVCACVLYVCVRVYVCVCVCDEIVLIRAGCLSSVYRLRVY